ncbi:MAG: hypothetical protein E6R03_16220 [Hyphomicrobiaceae bacterium]|nr:MAG: hypothetical protein E6R03_16220 [Hyphomicrobiaceae bacterium]
MREYTLVMPRPWLSRALVEEICLKRAARYLGDSEIPVRPDGPWSSMPVSLFWQDNPPTNYTNAFGVYFKHGRELMICEINGFDGQVAAVYTDRPRVATYSAYGHDMHSLDTSGNISIDGGRLYTRILGTPGSYSVGKIDLFKQVLMDTDGEVIGNLKQKFKGW